MAQTDRGNRKGNGVVNYYNEHDPKAAEWLRELIRQGHIPAGEVDTRDIREVRATDLVRFTQCHFFAGIGGWSLALRLAGWPDEEPVWTGSCPCQPFSVGANDKAKGTGDQRDLWPCFSELISQRAPSTIFGEQVRNAISWGWWCRAKMDLEAQGYAAAATVLRADAIGAIHERKRLYWVADASGEGRQRRQQVQCVFKSAKTQFPIDGDAITRSRRAVAGNWADLLSGDGLSVAVVRSALKGFGNAIVPQVAAQFIQAYLEAKGELRPA